MSPTRLARLLAALLAASALLAACAIPQPKRVQAGQAHFKGT